MSADLLTGKFRNICHTGGVRRLIDTHSHIFLEEFAADVDDVVSRAADAGVDTFVLPNITLSGLEDLLVLRERYPDRCYASIGLHPTELSPEFRNDLSAMKGILDEDARSGRGLFHGIGEVGLDLYWEQDSVREQTEAFECQIRWALEYDLPLMVHSRNAFPLLCDILDKYRDSGLRGVFHCFSGGYEEACRLMEYEGFMFGIGGTVTYKKSLLPFSLPLIPRERVVVETDCPYLSPVPYRGSRNEPAYMVRTVEKIAGIWGCTSDEVAAVTTVNACNLFGVQ